MRAFNGEFLREARQIRKLTITELAKKTGISKQSLSLYENNDNKPDGDKIFKLATELKFPYDFFVQENNCNIDFTTTYFRSLVSTTKFSRTSVNVKMKYIAKIYEALLEVLDLPKFQFKLKNETKIWTNEEIENLANKLREEWDLGNNPIDDMQYLLESHGILVTSLNADDVGIDAFSKKVKISESDVFIVAINELDKPIGRINFDLAHELGHILMHPWTEDLELLSNDEFRKIEREANKFAGVFLLPTAGFEKDVKGMGSDLSIYLNLREKWHVSMQAMIYRSHELGCISLFQYQYLMRKISQNGWRKHEPNDKSYRLKKNVFQSAIDLLKENEFTSLNIMNLFRKHGVQMYHSDIEELLNLENGILMSEEKNIIKEIKIKQL